VPHVHIDPKAVMNAQLARLCQPFVNPDKGVHTEAEALSGALRILSDRPGTQRAPARRRAAHLGKHGVLSVRPIAPTSARRTPPLAAQAAPAAAPAAGPPPAGHPPGAEGARAQHDHHARSFARAAQGARRRWVASRTPAHEEVLREVALQALQHRLLPMVEQDVRLELKERADSEALRFLAQHLRQMLLTPPLVRERVAGIDVSAKGDWSVVPLDEQGLPLADETRIEPGEKEPAALGAELSGLLKNSASAASRWATARARARPSTASAPRWPPAARRRTSSWSTSRGSRATPTRSWRARSWPARACRRAWRSASAAACRIRWRDPQGRSAPPGLGSEQGLVSKANARRVFQETVESCVAHVGCDVNAAPLSVLVHMPGLGREVAHKILRAPGRAPFASREELRQEGVLSEAQWTSAIAFLRVYGSSEPLDRTALHPEQYALVRNLFDSAGTSVEQGLGRMGATRGLRRPERRRRRHVARRDARDGLPRPRSAAAPAPAELLDPATDPCACPGPRHRGRDHERGQLRRLRRRRPGQRRDGAHQRGLGPLRARRARVLSIGQVVRARIQDASSQRLSLSLKNVPREERPPRRGERAPRAAPARADPRDAGATGGAAASAAASASRARVRRPTCARPSRGATA
jgi:hypothetical protein